MDCLFFKQGRCSKGSLCPYKHDPVRAAARHCDATPGVGWVLQPAGRVSCQPWEVLLTIVRSPPPPGCRPCCPPIRKRQQAAWHRHISQHQ